MAEQILHTYISLLSHPILSRVLPPSAKTPKKKIRFGKDAYTQYTDRDNAMNVNYTAVIWIYDSI